jgi:hypothetical protein
MRQNEMKKLRSSAQERLDQDFKRRKEKAAKRAAQHVPLAVASIKTAR